MKEQISLLSKLFLLWLLLASTAFAGDQGLLWHISGKGADSYLFGTMHSEDPEVLHLTTLVEQQFNAAKTLMLEVSLDTGTEVEVAAQMMLPAENSLSAVVGEALSREAKRAMQERGVPPEVTERLQPWATALTLSLPEQQSGLFLDKRLYQLALEKGKNFQPLESAEEQLAVFTTLTEGEQKALLGNVLKEYKSYPVLFEQMTQAYLSGNLTRLQQMNEAHHMSSDPTLQRKMMRRLLDERNQRMVERMLPMLREGKVFVAVGALHLPGKVGMISLLRRQGYTVRPLD